MTDTWQPKPCPACGGTRVVTCPECGGVNTIPDLPVDQRCGLCLGWGQFACECEP